MRVLVTGGTGFVGVQVRKFLQKRDIHVKVLSRRPSELLQLKGNEIGEYFDLFDPSSWPSPEKEDSLIHLAWGNLDNFLSADHLVRELPAQQEFLNKMTESGLSSLLVAGTCLEYGLVEGGVSENFGTHPTSPYGEAKLQLLIWLQELQRSRDFKLMWPRIFYAYGIGQIQSALFPTILKILNSESSIIEISDGSMERDFVAIELVASSIVDLLILDRDVGPVNVGTGSPLSIKAFIEMIAEDSGRSISIREGARIVPNYESRSFWSENSYFTGLFHREEH